MSKMSAVSASPKVPVMVNYTSNDNIKHIAVSTLDRLLKNSTDQYNEVLMNNCPCKLYMDFDNVIDDVGYDVENATESTYDALCDTFRDHIADVFLPFGDFIILGYDFPTVQEFGKIGFHVIFYNFRTTPHTIKTRFIPQYQPMCSYAMDKGIYSSNSQKFRLPLCPKKTDKGMEDRRYVPLYGDYTLERCCLTLADDCEAEEIEDMKPKAPGVRCSIDGLEEVLTGLGVPVEDLEDEGDYVRVKYYHGSHCCLLCDRKHDQQNYFVKQSEKGRLYLRCFAEPKKSRDITPAHLESKNPMQSSPSESEPIQTSPSESSQSEESSQAELFAVLKNDLRNNIPAVSCAILEKYKDDMILYKPDPENPVKLYVWNPTNGIWNQKDADSHIRHIVNLLIREMSDELAKKHDDELRKAIQNLCNMTIQKHLITYMVSDPEEIITKTEIHWNLQPFLFAFKNGVYDLKTHQFRPAKKSEFISQTTRHTYKDYNEVKQISIRRITDLFASIFPKEEERSFAIRLNALGLCGLVKQNFVVSLGDGANGKGLLINLRKQLLDIYHYTMSIDWFLETKHGRQANAADAELAGMEGKRYVDVDEPKKETSNGVSLRINKLKSLTGGNHITTRGLYESVKTYQPVALINFSTNYRINMPEDDGGIMRRIVNMVHRVKFVSDPEHYDMSKCRYSTTISKKNDKIDQFTDDELLACFHILAHSLEWDKIEEDMELALGIPETFKNETKEYMESMDGMPAFLAKYLIHTGVETDRVNLKDLHACWLDHKTGSKSYSVNGLKEYLSDVKYIKVYKNSSILSIKGYKLNDGVEVEQPTDWLGE